MQTRPVRKDACGDTLTLRNSKASAIKHPRTEEGIESAGLAHDGLRISEAAGGVAHTMDHIAIQRAVAYLIEGEHLTASEEEHLVRCDECRRHMMQAAMSDLEV